VGDGVAVIAVTSRRRERVFDRCGNGVFGDPLGDDFVVVAARATAFLFVLLTAALMSAPVRA
jgi:hypothetical protein